jgi:hypothetical protein
MANFTHSTRVLVLGASRVPSASCVTEDAMKKSIVATLILAALAGPAAAQVTAGMDMIAITAGQAAQVNVVNAGSASPSAPCHLSIVFYDRDGNAIGGLRSGTALASGEIASASIEHPSLRAGERYLVRVHVRKLESKASGRNECDGVRATAEIFDTDTGKTTIFWKLADD